MLAELSAPVPWSETSHFLFGMIGVLGVVSLILGVTIQFKKLFGKSPPMDDQIKTLRDEFTRADHAAAEATKKSVAGAYRRIEEERKDREEAFEHLALDRQRTLNHIRDDFESIRTAQAVTNKILEHIKERLE